MVKLIKSLPTIIFLSLISVVISLKAQPLSTTWDAMSEKFEATLHAHELTLRLLSERLKKSELSGEQLEGSLKLLSRLNSDLRTSSEQLGQRLQERDMDLMRQEQIIDKLNKNIIFLKIASIALGMLLGISLFLLLRRS
jgi:hypothetical protein